MDRFTRNYSLFLGLILLAGVIWWLTTLDFRARSLNALLKDDPVVAAYVYPFRVMGVDDGVARMTTPRTAQVPVLRFLSIVKPELRGLAAGDPAVVTAQQELAQVQARAREIVLAEADVEEVRWVLDRAWYEQQGVTP